MAGASAGFHGEPVAWLIDCGGEWQMVSLSREHADAAADENDGEVVPLYLHPTLTDEEREAVAYCVSCAQDYRETLDCCEQSEKYGRATRMIDAAMRVVILTVGPASAERLGSTEVADAGGAGPT
jgi:hypothetical protein